MDRPISNSCLLCRKRKVKCDSGHPCKSCAIRNVECIYRPKLKPGLKKGSGKKLENKLKDLENRLYDSTSLLNNINLTLPSSNDTINFLLNLYFQSIHYQTPFINKTKPIDTLTLHSIISTTLSLVKDDKSFDQCLQLDIDMNDHISKCNDKVLLESSKSINLDSLQSLTLLSFQTLRDANSPPNWSCLFTLSRIVNIAFNSRFQPFMQTTRILTQNISALSEEMKRLYWSSFIIDRLASFTTGWEFGIKLNNEIQLPCYNFEIDGNNSQSIEIFNNYINLMKFNCDIHNLLSNSIDLNDEYQVHEWKTNHKKLDEELNKNFNINKINEISVQLLYYATIIRLHSPYAYPPSQTTIFESSPLSMKICDESSKEISKFSILMNSHLMNDDIYVKGLYTSPLVVWCLWVAARNNLLAYSHSSSNGFGLPIEFYQLNQSLRILEPNSKLAKAYADVLDKITSHNLDSNILTTARTSFSVLQDASSNKFKPVQSNPTTSEIDSIFKDIFSSLG